MRLESPVGFSAPGGADTSAPFTPATPGPGGGRGFLTAHRAVTYSFHPLDVPPGHPFLLSAQLPALHPPPRQVTLPSGGTDEAEKPGGLFRPRRRRHLCAVYPGIAGAGGRTRVLVCPSSGRHSFHHAPPRCPIGASFGSSPIFVEFEFSYHHVPTFN